MIIPCSEQPAYKNVKPKRVRISIREKRSPVFVIASTDGEFIQTKDGRFPLKKFLVSSRHKTIMFLTKKEEYFLRKKLPYLTLDVIVIEDLYGSISGIKYTKDLTKNLLKLASCIRKVSNTGLAGISYESYFSNINAKKIEREIKFKNSLDDYFFFSEKQGYQEVFKLSENRPGRSIIALDFNSMFASSLSEKFLSPKNIKHTTINKNLRDVENLDLGLYKVKLSRLNNERIKSIHPFSYKEMGRQYLFELNYDHEITTTLYNEEIEYYSDFFDEVFVYEGFYSNTQIDHPLKKKSQKVYQKRLSSSSYFERGIQKSNLLSMHACSRVKIFQTKSFQNIADLKRFIYDYLNIDYSSIMNNANFLSVVSQNPLLSLRRRGQFEFELKYFSYKNQFSINSFYSRVIALSRLKIFSTIMSLLKFESLEICYVNVDSIHISIDERLQERFLSEYRMLFGDTIGKLKLECIATNGYWFDTGRYWLINAGKVIKHKNKVFSKQNSGSMFDSHRKISVKSKGDDVSYFFEKSIFIYNNFSYTKKLSKTESGNIEYKRFEYNEIESDLIRNNTYLQEELRTKKTKIDLFNTLKQQYDLQPDISRATDKKTIKGVKNKQI